MEIKLSTITLSIFFSLTTVAWTNEVKAELSFNGSNLTGQVSRPTSQDYGEHRSKGLQLNGSSLKRKKNKAK